MRKKSLKIGIDIRCLGEGKKTGVEEYTINLLENLFEADSRNKYVLFSNSFRQPKGDLQSLLRHKNVSLKRFRFPNKILNLLFWYLGWPQADKMLGGVDIFFMPNISFIAVSKQTKLVLTVHDLSFEYMPETFSLKRRMWHMLINPRKLCQRADFIVAVSDSTKNDLMDRYDISPGKIIRIYSGVSDDYHKLDRNDKILVDTKEKYSLPFRFIFFLGTIEPRKNIPSLIRAFDRIKDLEIEKSYSMKLVIAGSKGWKYGGIIEAMEKSKRTKDIIFINNLPDKDKNAVYNLASIFVYPSLLEGFGFPVLEAMKCGVPVIASNSSSIPEIVGSDGVLVDPEKPEEIFLAMRHLLEDKTLSERLGERGWRRSFMFSWKSSARDFLEILENL